MEGDIRQSWESKQELIRRLLFPGREIWRYRNRTVTRNTVVVLSFLCGADSSERKWGLHRPEKEVSTALLTARFPVRGPVTTIQPLHYCITRHPRLS